MVLDVFVELSEFYALAIPTQEFVLNKREAECSDKRNNDHPDIVM